MAEASVLAIVTELRTEATAFREETRANFAMVFRQLDRIDAVLKDVRERLASIEAGLA